jgi:hypothetical protein
MPSQLSLSLSLSLCAESKKQLESAFALPVVLEVQLAGPPEFIMGCP